MPNHRYDFAVSKELSRSVARIYGVAIEGDSFLIEFFDQKDKMIRVKSYITGDKHNDLDSVKKLVLSRLSCFLLDDVTSVYLTDKLVDVMDQLYDTHACARYRKY